ncbi:MAG: LamG domain-containing protein, partial [Rhodobiaceae bacterium]|nr:LamG domain-containing protein [Rhodobiaceae bacterium]
GWADRDDPGPTGGTVSYDTGTSGDFHGTTQDYAAVAHDSAFEVADGTVQFWFNADTTNGTQTLFAKDGYGNDGGLTISLVGDTLTVQMEDGGTSYAIMADTAVGTGSWHNVALTFGANGMALYLDGVVVGTNAFTGGLTDNRDAIVIGASNERNRSNDLSRQRLINAFDGHIDEVAVYGQALTVAQIQAVITSGPLAAVDVSGFSFEANAAAGGSDDWLWLDDHGCPCGPGWF